MALLYDIIINLCFANELSCSAGEYMRSGKNCNI